MEDREIDEKERRCTHEDTDGDKTVEMEQKEEICRMQKRSDKEKK